jgi:hypothetical protein
MSGVVFKLDPQHTLRKKKQTLIADIEQEHRFEKHAYERVQNARVSFTKVGTTFRRAITRYLSVNEGRLDYFKNVSGGKSIGYYVFGPGTRVTLLNMGDEDLSQEIIESGMQCLRIHGLKKSNGKTRGPLFILFDNKSEAHMWQRAMSYSVKLGKKCEEPTPMNGHVPSDIGSALDDDTKTDGSPKVFLTGASEMGSSDVVSSRQMPIENLGLAKTNIQVLQSMEETTTNDPVSKSVPVSDEDDDGEGGNNNSDGGVNVEDGDYLLIGEPGDVPIDGAETATPVDRDSLLRNQRVVFNTSRFLQSSTNLPRDLFYRQVSKLGIRKLMNTFAFSKEVKLSNYDIYVVAATMFEALEGIGSSIIPQEVFGMYESSFEEITETGSGRVAKDIRIIKDLFDMMSSSNVRIIREVSAAVRMFCMQHHPWELGIRPARRFDDTRRNLAPRFASILVKNEHNADKLPCTAAIVLMRVVLQHHDTVFGYDIEETVNKDDKGNSESVNRRNSEQTVEPIDSLNNDGESSTSARHRAAHQRNEIRSQMKQMLLEKSVESATDPSSFDVDKNRALNEINDTEKISENKPRDTEPPEDGESSDVSDDSIPNVPEDEKDERTVKLEQVIKKYETKIATYKLDVDDKYILQDWLERVENSKALLKGHLKKTYGKAAPIDEVEVKKRRVTEALAAAQALRDDKKHLNLVEVRRTLREVKQIWIQARATGLGAMNASLGDGSTQPNVSKLLKRSDAVLADVQGKVNLMRERAIKLTDSRIAPRVMSKAAETASSPSALETRKAKELPSPSRFATMKSWLTWGMGMNIPNEPTNDSLDETYEGPTLTNDVCRTLIEILNENLKLRSQLNAYTEAILLPTLEKEAEFQRTQADKELTLDDDK